MSERGEGAGAVALRENHILCAAGISDSLSAWRLWRLMTGAEEPAPYSIETIERSFRRSLKEELETYRGVRIVPWGGDLSFEGPFVVTKPWVVAEGAAPMHPGSVLMMEMPSRRTFDFVWRNGYDTLVPAHTRAKAQLRMAVTGLERACVWVVGDNGEIDEVHVVDRDDEEIARLREACRAAIERAESGEEPSPDDEDLGRYAEAHAGSNSVRLVAPGEAVAIAFDDYVAIKAQEKEASALARGLGKKADVPGTVLKRALVETPTLDMPNGQRLTMEAVVSVRKASTSRYDKLVIRDKGEGD